MLIYKENETAGHFLSNFSGVTVISLTWEFGLEYLQYLYRVFSQLCLNSCAAKQILSGKFTLSMEISVIQDG